jgi:hypothetical protein
LQSHEHVLFIGNLALQHCISVQVPGRQKLDTPRWIDNAWVASVYQKPVSHQLFLKQSRLAEIYQLVNIAEKNHTNNKCNRSLNMT